MPTNLSDTQLLLLTSAAARSDRSLLPVPPAVRAPKPTVTRSLAALLARGLAEERAVADLATAYRADGEQQLGLFLTRAGRLEIGAGEPESETPACSATKGDLTVPQRQTKSALVLALLRREQGATAAELGQATGWQPHSVRSALTGLRKQGLRLEKGKRGDALCYTVAA